MEGRIPPAGIADDRGFRSHEDQGVVAMGPSTVFWQQLGEPERAALSTAGRRARFRPGTTISVTWTSPSGKQATSSLYLTAGPPQ